MRSVGRYLRYGGPWFSVSSALPVAGGLSRPSALARLCAAVVARPWRLVALVGLLVGSPRIEVTLSDSAVGEVLREHFARRFLGLIPQTRLCRGVLALPDRESDYLRGRNRRALRNNLRRAAAAGIRCEGEGCVERALGAMREVLLNRRAAVTVADGVALAEHWPAVFARPEVTTLVARDAARGALAVAAVVTDDEICVILLAVASSHEARWALHYHLVQTLIARRVTYLLAVDGGPLGALGLPPEVQYYQHLLGYACAHVVPSTATAAHARRTSLRGERAPRRRSRA
jgi:hypothetical protein